MRCDNGGVGVANFSSGEKSLPIRGRGDFVNGNRTARRCEHRWRRSSAAPRKCRSLTAKDIAQPN